MLIGRALCETIRQRLVPGKAVIILGPRQAGKSTILRQIAQYRSITKVRAFDCDDAAVRERDWGHTYFWRTAQQQEVDYLEEYDGQLYACEFKWNPGKRASLPITFQNAYPGTIFEVVRPDNYHLGTALK